MVIDIFKAIVIWLILVGVDVYLVTLVMDEIYDRKIINYIKSKLSKRHRQKLYLNYLNRPLRPNETPADRLELLEDYFKEFKSREEKWNY